MDLRRAGLPEKPGDSSAGGSPDDGIVYQDHTLSGYALPDGAELQPHLIQPVLLSGGDKRAAYILVFDQADLIGNAGCPAVPQRRVQAGVRHTDDRIRLHRVGLRQDRSPRSRAAWTDTPSITESGRAK